MEAAGLDRTRLAERIGTVPARVSELLSAKGWKASPAKLKWALKIIKACGGTEADLQHWTTYHGEVTAYQVADHPTALPRPPGTEVRHGRDEAVDPVVRRLRRLSAQLGAELDVSGTPRLDGDQVLLGRGLYVRRTRQTEVLGLLRPDRYDKPVLVRAAAGEGKSSLLWGLHHDLAGDPMLEPFLLDATWLSEALDEPPLLSTDDLLRVAASARERGHVALFLIDTVDLVLRDRRPRQLFVDLCEELTEAGAEIALTSRPDESLKLPAARFRTVVLGEYDDVELPVAVDRCVAAFCTAPPTGAPLDEQVRRLLMAEARGLPLRDIVRNPLKLRLLFELYAPDFPPQEHDVSSLYRAYWQRRVHTDQRGELGFVDKNDLSRPAELTAIAMLAAGLPEVNEEPLLESAAAVASAWHRDTRRPAEIRAELDAGADGLAGRGVLIRSDRTLRFVHQTMFEYAAAIGLLDRDRERALTFLIDHLGATPDDLFVGAIAEQALILALDDPLLAPTAHAVLDAAVTGTVPLQRIALGVLAHRPSLRDTTRRLLDAVDAAARRRYARTVPTVADDDVSRQVAVLVGVWRLEPSARESVLEALTRLAGREPAIVAGVLKDLKCVASALAWTDAPERMVEITARALVAVAAAVPQWVREGMFTFFDDMVKRNNHRAVPLRLLGLIADHWAELGSSEVCEAVETRVVGAQRERNAAASEMKRALGRIRALEWRDRLAASLDHEWWDDVVDELCEKLQADYYDVLANAWLHAIAELVIGGALDAAGAVRTVRRLAMMPGSGVFALGDTLFNRLLGADDGADGNPAVVVTPAVVALLDGLPAPGNRPKPGAQRAAHAARQALRNAELPPARLAALLADVPGADDVDNWLADDHLVVLVVPAGVGGHAVARRALDRIAADAGVLSDLGRKNVSYDLARHLAAHPWLLGPLIDLSIRRASAAPLSDVVDEPDVAILAELSAHSTRLVDLLELLSTGKGEAQREAASLWRRLYRARAVPAPSHNALTAWFASASEPAVRGNLVDFTVDIALDDPSRHRVVDRMVRGLFEVDAGTGAVVSPRHGKAGHVPGSARASWLRLACRGLPVHEVDLAEVLRVATASPVSADNLAVVGRLVIRLVEQGDTAVAADLLLRIAGAADRVLLSLKQESGLANKVRTPARRIFRTASADVRDALLAKVPDLPRTFARVLVASAAQEDFDGARPALTALLDRRLPDGVAQQIHDDIKVRSRSAASGTLPELIDPLTRTEASGRRGPS
ncbi:hypothetical protein ACFXGA_00830 [Actinosynnema sp. NPDC059335]|uniref:hypothetical protein n=1 Tax=Actinosynnema sp. NPDC059335 TaxID=3346804 RepID=UPI00366E98C2